MRRVLFCAVAFGMTALVGCADDPEPPVIDVQPTVNNATVDETTGTATFSVTASGPGLVYAWAVVPDEGTFDDVAIAAPTWTAPTVSTTSHTPATSDYEFTLTVSNSDGNVISDPVTVTVTNLNEVPTVDTPAEASAATVLPGSTIDLSVVASDSEADGLTYAWIQMAPASPAGTFTNEDTANATWLAPAVAADTSFTFQVTISDADDNVIDTATSQATVPGWAADIYPIFANTMFNNVAGGCGACHGGGGVGGFAWDLTDANTAHMGIVGIAANNNCAGHNYITATDLADSGIFQKISVGAGTCNGNQMPNSEQGYFNNNPGERTMIESWILGGALND